VPGARWSGVLGSDEGLTRVSGTLSVVYPIPPWSTRCQFSKSPSSPVRRRNSIRVRGSDVCGRLGRSDRCVVVGSVYQEVRSVRPGSMGEHDAGVVMPAGSRGASMGAAATADRDMLAFQCSSRVGLLVVQSTEHGFAPYGSRRYSLGWRQPSRSQRRLHA
jgi:hypothetical protein